MRLRTNIALAALLAAMAGCRPTSPHANTEAQIAAYSAITLTSQSHEADVQAELALLQAERMLPAMLDADRGLAPQATAGTEELTSVLNSAFTASQLRFARDRSDAMFARGVDEWNPLALEKALQFRAMYAAPQERIRQAMAAPKARLQLPLATGKGLEVTCADAALIYVRLECIAAADALSRGEGDQAMAAIARALHPVEMLAAEPHVVTRLTAAIARADAFGATQRLVCSRIVTSAHLAQLERLVSDQLATWPYDGDAWIGDRAAGLCTYEMIRDGQLLSVLTADELAMLREADGVDIFATAVTKNADADEAHYLRAMRKVIDLCAQPHAKRAAAIELLNHERDALANSPQYPIIADRVLLAGIDEGLRQQAVDLALTKAWGIALAVACGASLPPPEVNPLTGENYSIQIAADCVVVADIDPLRPELQVSAPIASAARISSRGQATFDQPR